MTEHQKYIKDTYNWALENGLVRNKQDFAKKVGICYASAVSAMTGSSRFSAKTMVAKVKMWKAMVGNDKDKDIIEKATGWLEKNLQFGLHPCATEAFIKEFNTYMYNLTN